MAQVTIYLDDETLARARAAAEREGVSLSAWLGRLARERTRTEWPPELVASFGTWDDFPSAEEIRSGQPNDAPRESF